MLLFQSTKELKHQAKLASSQDELSQIKFQLEDADSKVVGQAAQIEDLTQKLKEVSTDRCCCVLCDFLALALLKLAL